MNTVYEAEEAAAKERRIRLMAATPSRIAKGLYIDVKHINEQSPRTEENSKTLA